MKKWAFGVCMAVLIAIVAWGHVRLARSLDEDDPGDAAMVTGMYHAVHSQQ